MKHSAYYFLTTILILFCLACSKDKAEAPSEEPKENEISIDLNNEQLTDFVQRATLNYFTEYAESVSGAARERYLVDAPTEDEHLVSTGGSGFGMMSIIAGASRGFLPASDAFTRLNKIITFFNNADRFHGAWPHWLDGRNGRVIAFSDLDDGADLVETSFLVQGLVAVREYYKNGTPAEQALSATAEKLIQTVEWNWFVRPNNDGLNWHWSPNNGWAINLKIQGYNECLVTYVLAASSKNFAINKEVYQKGWAASGNIKSSAQAYGIPLLARHPGNEQKGGPLFWSHYSFLGLCPLGLKDEYLNYEDVVKNHAAINYRYCLENPLGHRDYGENCWGLTASYSRGSNGELSYMAHSPANDPGVISPTAAISSLPYAPDESIRAMKYFYHLKDRLAGKAGFYDAFSPKFDYWTAKAWLAIDQGPCVVMIENYRTGLLWNLVMKAQDVQAGLEKLGFSYRTER